MFEKLVVCAAAMSLVILAGCDSSRAKPETVVTQKHETNGAASAEVENAKQVFSTDCASCHGKEGRGDGPGAARRGPRPRNFHDKAWQASVTDAQIEKVIVYGGAAVGKSPRMGANPDLAGKPALVTALRQYIRQLGKE